MPIPVVVGGLITALGGLLKLADNPIIAYFLVLAVLFIDSSAGFFFGFSGAIGTAFSWILTGLSGKLIIVSSFEIMILIAFVGVILLAIKLRK